MKHRAILVVALSLVVFGSVVVAATGADEAYGGFPGARHRVVETYRFPGFAVVQFELPVLSHYSYILRSGKAALIVDPSRDVRVYRDYLKEHGLRLAGVFLTHSHADFVAGHMELARRDGCPVFQSAASGAKYEFKGLADGATIKFGGATLKAIATPGHTPDGMCAAVSTGGEDAPKVLLTGDTLFIGSVGRPDLLEGTLSAAALASMAFDTWTRKLSPLPDSVRILPAHGAGSLCGSHLSDEPSATLGEQRKANPYLQHASRAAFVTAVLSDLPEAPQYFRHNAAMNRSGPPLVAWDAEPKRVTPSLNLTDTVDYSVVDVRSPERYARGHVPNSLNVGVRGRFEQWVGIMVLWGEDVVVVGDADELKDAVLRLHRVGYRATAMAMQAWEDAGLAVRKNACVPPGELQRVMSRNDGPLVVDVRGPQEVAASRVGAVLNLPLTRLADLSAKLDPSQWLVTVCRSSYRSSMAIGVLEAKGFSEIATLAGGMAAWEEEGKPVIAAQAAASADGLRLAGRLSADALKSTLMDLPGSVELVDIRPAAHFAEYRVPGSKNVTMDDLTTDKAYLEGTKPLIVIDRDGSLAMQVAAVLAQRTRRPVQALHGGLQAYWEETMLKPAVRAVPLPAKKSVSPREPAPVKSPAARKKSAGC